MHSKAIAGLVLVGAAAFAACGSSGGSTPTGAAAANATTSPTTVVKSSDSRLGAVLVNADGRTLYGFTNDKNGTSSCTGTCAANWPALEVSPGWKAGSGIGAAASFHTIKRADGHLQLAVGKWPLYVFSGDSAPGDVNGQGVLGKWFVVRTDGTLLKDASAAASTTTTMPSASGSGY